MIVKCPECAHVRSVSEDFIPAKAEFATCPRCGSRFRFRTVPKDPLPKIAAAPLAQEQLPAPAPKAAQSGAGDIWDAVNSLNEQWQDGAESAPAKADAPELGGAASPIPPSSLSSSPLPAASPAQQKTAATQKKEHKGLFSFLKRIEKSATTPGKGSTTPLAESSPLQKVPAHAAPAAYDDTVGLAPAEPRPLWEQELETPLQPLPPRQQQSMPPAPQQEDLLHPFPAEHPAPAQPQTPARSPKPTVQTMQAAPQQATSAPMPLEQAQPEPQHHDTPSGAATEATAAGAAQPRRIRVRATVVADAAQPAAAPATAAQPMKHAPQAAGQTPASLRPAPPPGSPAAKLLEKARALQEAELQERAALAAQEQQDLNAALQAEMEEQNAVPPIPTASNTAVAPVMPAHAEAEQTGTPAASPVASQMPPWAEQVPAKTSAEPLQMEKDVFASSRVERAATEAPAMLHTETVPLQEPQPDTLPQETAQAEDAPAGALPRIRVRPVRREYTDPDFLEVEEEYGAISQAAPSGKKTGLKGRFLGTLYPEVEDRLLAASQEQPEPDTGTHAASLPSPQAVIPKEVELRPDAHDEAVPGSIEDKVAGDLLLMLAPAERPVRNLGTLDEFTAHDRSDGPQLLQGIPWENLRQAGWIRGFFATIHMVMFNSAFFYSHIKERGSLTPSYLFMLLLGYIALLCSSLWVQGLNAFMGETTAPLLTPAFALPTLLLLTPVYLGALQIVTATLIQSILRLSTSEKGQFPLIFKMLGYAFAPLILSVIPFVGPIAGGVWFFFSLVTGCRVALGLKWGQLIPALLLPLALVGGCVAILFM